MALAARRRLLARWRDAPEIESCRPALMGVDNHLPHERRGSLEFSAALRVRHRMRLVPGAREGEAERRCHRLATEFGDIQCGGMLRQQRAGNRAVIRLLLP